MLRAENEQGPETTDILATALFRAYFTDGGNVSDHDVLVDCASAVGLDADDARKMLDGNAYADALRESQQQAQRRGITGAQPTESFLEVLDATATNPAPDK